MSGEEYLARQYCEPKPSWHCLRKLAGGNYYSFKELNCPEYWLDALGKYTQQKPSAPAKQLHRRVEAARAEFRAKQDKAWGAGRVDRAVFDRKELSAWNTFSAQKQAYLKDYLKAVATGTIERRRRRRRHRCEGEDCTELLSGRARFCVICRRARHREAARAYRRNQPCSVISYTREISPKNRAFSYPDTPIKIAIPDYETFTTIKTGSKYEALPSGFGSSISNRT